MVHVEVDSPVMHLIFQKHQNLTFLSSDILPPMEINLQHMLSLRLIARMETLFFDNQKALLDCGKIVVLGQVWTALSGG